MHVTIIGGASTIGSTAAFALAATDPSLDITLVDIADKAAWGHATDLLHASYFFTDAPVSMRDVDELGTVRSVGTDELAGVDPDLAVVAASVPRSEWSDGDQRRERFTDTLPVADDVAGQLKRLGPLPVVVVTNPVDRITYRLWDLLGWSPKRFIGFSLAESARIADAIAQFHDGDPNVVQCPTMGEHGEHVVPIFSRATVDGSRVEIPDDRRTEIIDYVRDIGFDIANRRGMADSSRWVSGAGIAHLVRTILGGGTEEPHCVSTPLNGAYGFDDGCLSVPVTLDGDGVESVVEWDLEDSERERLRQAHNVIYADIESMGGEGQA